jgi:urease accessory protein
MNLRLLQLGDSALPIGGYSHSWGLEAAIDQDSVRDAAGLERWLSCWLDHTLAPCEGILVAAVTRAASSENWREVVRANVLFAANITPPSLRHASRDMGEQLLALADVWPWAATHAGRARREGADRFGPWYHAPVFGILAAAAGATPHQALSIYLHQSSLGVISAGVRCIPIGHTHGQQLLARLHDQLARLAEQYCDCELDEAGSFAPAYEVLCDAQTRLYTRLFRS